jgi:predicted metalloendopeptidase
MKRLLPVALVALAMLAAVTGCGKKAEAPVRSGISVANMDTTVRPQDDFFAYANGGWLASTEIPSDLPTIGSFVELFLESERKRHAILEELAAQTDLTDTEKKLGDLYSSFMDSSAIEAAGVSPLAEELARIEAIASPSDLLAHFGRNARIGIQSVAGFFIDGDFDDSKTTMLYMGQSGIGLPNRDYYLKDDARLASVREQYEAYIGKQFGLAGVEGGAAKASAILALETKIARAQWKLEDAQDVSKTHNRYAVADLGKLSKRIEWARLFEGAGIGDITELNVSHPSFFTGLGDLVAGTDLATWKDYARFKLIHASAGVLPQAFVDAQFEFNRAVLGTRALPERWKRGTRLVDNNMGMAMGEIYVKRHFPPEAKARMDQLVANLQAAMKDNIEELEWMGPETRAKAQDKLAKFVPQIGYPSKWIDFATLEIRRDDVFGNVRRASAFEFQRQLNKLGKPADLEDWGLTPQTVNAYYDPPLNKIVFPAAILQPPFFDMAADDAMNYGAIGGVIGHEISHGFDDDGRKYDGDGNLKDWWTAEDDKAFTERADMLVAQYAEYEPQPGIKVNGRLTLGENIGDLSGLTIAYRAYQKSLNGAEAPVIDGLTGDQRFFLGWATIWRNKMTDEIMRMIVLSDPHSPGMYRVNGVVANMPEFYEAFDVKSGDALYMEPEKRVKLW